MIPTKVGPERRQEILDDIANQGTYLPRGVSYEDCDGTFIKFIEEDLEVVMGGKKVPVIFLTLQRFTEFSKTWQHADEFKNIKMPFITIVRLPNVQVGTNQAGLWNIPGRRTYSYIKVPTGGKKREVDVYKIPQPTSVDFTYEVRLFCNRMRDLNKLNSKVQLTFQSRQFYIRVNGHPMPVTLENIGDESQISDFNKRRFYVQPFEMKLAAYILNEDEFEVIPAVSRAMVLLEVSEEPKVANLRVKADKNNNTINCNFVFKPNANIEFTFRADYSSTFSAINNVNKITNILIRVNGVQKFNGLALTLSNSFVVEAGDMVFIKVTKELSDTGKFQLSGNLL